MSLNGERRPRRRERDLVVIVEAENIGITNVVIHLKGIEQPEQICLKLHLKNKLLRMNMMTFTTHLVLIAKRSRIFIMPSRITFQTVHESYLRLRTIRKRLWRR